MVLFFSWIHGLLCLFCLKDLSVGLVVVFLPFFLDGTGAMAVVFLFGFLSFCLMVFSQGSKGFMSVY